MLWAYRTTPWCSMGETPFSMTYGVEAIIPMETGLPTSRTNVFQVGENELCKHLDLIEESQDVASIRLAKYKQRICRGYHKGIKNREFIPRDLVLRKVLGNNQDPAMGKLGPTWEGPYPLLGDAYRLEDLDERPIARPWNVFNLKKYNF